jgi:hypothetical protein
LPFRVRINKQSPDIARFFITYCKAANLIINDCHPSFSGLFNGGRIVFLRNGSRCQPILSHGEADAMHSRNIGARGGADMGGHEIYLTSALKGKATRGSVNPARDYVDDASWSV